MRPGLHRIPAHAPGKRPARRTTIWDQCGADNPSQTPRRSLECGMEGWRDDWVALPGDWSSTDPGGIHQQPVLMSSLWGGSGPRHPRDAQFARRDADAISTSRAGLIARLLSRTVTPCLAWRPGHEATASSPVARHGVRHRDWAVRLRRPRLAARPHANVRRSRLALDAHCDRAPTLLDPDRQASLQSWICALGGPGSG